MYKKLVLFAVVVTLGGLVANDQGLISDGTLALILTPTWLVVLLPLWARRRK
jgi:hypothetical protein